MQDMNSVSSKKRSDRRRSSYHLVFVPKCRFNMFRSRSVRFLAKAKKRPCLHGLFRSRSVRFLAKEFFKGIAAKYGFVIHALEIVSSMDNSL